MKNALLFLMLLLSGMAGAQIVNIPDAVFKNDLLTGHDISAKNSAGNIITVNTNGDGEIQLSEALAVWEMTINSNSDVVSIQGIGAFTNLRKFTCDMVYNLAFLDLTSLLNLENLSISYFQGNEININGLSNLKSLIIESTDYADISNAGLSGLTDLEINYSESDIDITQMPALERVHMIESGQRIGDFSGCSNLQVLVMEHAYRLQSITLGDKPLLTELSFDNWGSSANLVSLDISGCMGLTRLNIYYGDPVSQQGVRFLNLKNGVTEYESFSVTVKALDWYHAYVCVEEGMEGLITADDIQSGQYIQVSTYCSFTPGGNYNTITGNLTFDSDNNGCDSNDSYTGFVRLNANNGPEQSGIFTTSGHYNFYTQAGIYTITPQLENDWFTISPAIATITQATVDNSTATQNFCIAANGVHPDVEVVVVGEVAQPGFEADYWIIYRNKGNQTLSGTVILNYDDNVQDYVSSYPTETTSGTGTLTWDYMNLLPFETRKIRLTLNLNGPMEIPAVNIDDVLTFSASITPTTSDETPADNTFTLNQTVGGSFDPNDITCLEGSSVSPDKIGEYLHYNINFENTGTAPATFIVVKDMVDGTKFDISSLQLMDASHAIETRINGNKVEFIFDNINLGPEEKGNVTFKIKTLNTLQVNDDVMQQADIFFDYNWPIQTNQATTTFEVLSRSDFAMDNSVKVYPNPAKHIITISADSNINSIQFYDIQGRLLQSGTVNGTDTTFDLSSRNSGMYFIKVFTDKGIKVEKVAKE